MVYELICIREQHSRKLRALIRTSYRTLTATLRILRLACRNEQLFVQCRSYSVLICHIRIFSIIVRRKNVVPTEVAVGFALSVRAINICLSTLAQTVTEPSHYLRHAIVSFAGAIPCLAAPLPLMLAQYYIEQSTHLAWLSSLTDSAARVL